MTFACYCANIQYDRVEVQMEEVRLSSVQLLDKTRKINKLLHNNASTKVAFNDICSVMREIVASNVLVISRKGKILGTGSYGGIDLMQNRSEERRVGKEC